MKLLFWGVMERALQMTAALGSKATGHFKIESSIPVGAGMGASAALCVGVGRWFESNGWVQRDELAEFCRKLENLFHGDSSGVDIAVAISAEGLHFERGGSRYLVAKKWDPQWCISYSGKRGVTSECIARVKTLWDRDQLLGEKIDADMREASRMAEQALTQNESNAALELLANAIGLARSCFERWGLTSGETGSHIQMLMNEGAYAVKPTGSGDGGFVLSLWRTPPPNHLKNVLIPLGLNSKAPA